MRLCSQNLVRENEALLLRGVLLPLPIGGEIAEIRVIHSRLDADEREIPDRARMIRTVHHLGIRSQSNCGDDKTQSKNDSLPHSGPPLLRVEISSPTLRGKRDRSSQQG